MRLVIEIPENMDLRNYDIPYDILNIITSGKLLPKSYGRLIDADELEECKEVMNTIMGEAKYAIRMEDIRNAPTIIEGSKQ